MKQHQKIVWAEGMPLKPHAFQQQERYWQQVLNNRQGMTGRFGWGLSALAIQEEALAGGQFALDRCAGIMPDGMTFVMPKQQPLPLTAHFQDMFDAKRRNLSVYLSIPAIKPGSENCLLDNQQENRATRFVLHHKSFPDENTGENEQEIPLGYPNFNIQFGDSPPPGYTSIKIARIKQQNGTFALDGKYLPPMLHFGAMAFISERLQRLIGLLSQRSSTLKLRRQRDKAGEVGFGPADVKLFWLLHTINSAIPDLLHWHQLQDSCVHPEELYRSLLTLAGQLSTFTDRDSNHFLQYDHTRLFECFNSIFADIRQLLEQAVPPPNFVKIPLNTKDRLLYTGRVVNESLFSTSQFYLILKGNAEERKLAAELPQHLKIASPEKIQILATSASSGLKVQGISHQPQGLPGGPDIHYFQLNQTEKFWDNICHSGAIAILFTAAFKKLKPTLVAVREDK